MKTGKGNEVRILHLLVKDFFAAGRICPSEAE